MNKFKDEQLLDLPEAPDYHAMKFWNSTVPNHAKVVRIEQVDDRKYRIERSYGDTITCFLSNQYDFTLTDYHAIIARHGDVDAIINISDWNGYSLDAKNLSVENRIGLFKLREFLGALHWNKNFYRYVKKED